MFTDLAFHQMQRIRSVDGSDEDFCGFRFITKRFCCGFLLVVALFGVIGETSRSNNSSSESVSKRICCSFLFVTAFFGIISGFFLGRFLSSRALQAIRNEMEDVEEKVAVLNINIKLFFYDLDQRQTNCSAGVKNSCYYPTINNESSITSMKETLSFINSCFNNG